MCNLIVYNSNKMHMSQSLFNLTTALHVSGVTITHLQEHKTTVTTASGNRYTVLLSAAIVEELKLVYSSTSSMFTCFGCHYYPSSGAQNNCNYSIW
jgi:deoxyxylulose-5-phosphate synthase